MIQLDHAKLQPNRRDKSRFRCPACAASGGDKRSEHLKIFSDGTWGCCIDSSREHTRSIINAAGIKTDSPQPTAAEIARRARQDALRQAAKEKADADRRNRARRALGAIMRNFQWNYSDLILTSPHALNFPSEHDPMLFIKRMFGPDEIVWCGDYSDSGEPRHACHWRTAAEWQDCETNPGPLTHPAIWQPGHYSRSLAGIVSKNWIVLEVDKHPITGIEPDPQDLDAIDELHAITLSIVRFIRERAGWELGAIVDSGNKSLHAWFRHPRNLEAVKADLEALGIDGNMLRTNQPARLPGHFRNSGRLSKTLWLR